MPQAESKLAKRRSSPAWALSLLALLASSACKTQREAPSASGGLALAAPFGSSSAALAAPVPVNPIEPARLITHERQCMGTKCTLSVFHHDQARVDAAVERAFGEIRRLDALMTTWTLDSEVSRINAAAGSGKPVRIGGETFDVLKHALWIADRSEGAFDITVGAFKGLWKFDEDNDGTLPSDSAVKQRLRLVDYHDVILDPRQSSVALRRPGQQITLGGIAKGYIVDRAVAVLRTDGFKDFLVQAGGDLYAAGQRGDRPWRVGVQDPRAARSDGKAADASFAMITLSDAAFNTSGDYERFIIKDGKRYHHILDPRTGYPVAHTRSVTVLAPSSFLADTLDTALFVMGTEKGLAFAKSLPAVEVLIVDGDNQVHTTPGLAGKLTLLHAPTDGI
jgi:thiamine biosynthesis lipoprotein